MKQGFVKVAAVTPKIVVADTKEHCVNLRRDQKGRAGGGKDHCAPGTLHYGLYVQ